VLNFRYGLKNHLDLFIELLFQAGFASTEEPTRQQTLGEEAVIQGSRW
jgi:hypothetical protein